MSVKLMIDSASDITKKEAAKKGVILVPIEVRFGSDEFLDGVDITPEEFYEKLEKCEDLPKTSLINEFRWSEEFEKATKDGDELVVITLSSKLSGTYNSAKEAASGFETVYVVDSLSATIGERLLLDRAIELAMEGKSAEEIAKELDEIKYKLNIVAFVDTLKYLKMGGRISSATAFVGEMLAIKPIISVIDGSIKQVGKAMGVRKAIMQIKSMVGAKGINFSLPYGLVWSGLDEDNINKFEQGVNALWQGKGVNKHIIGSTIGTHVGPGAAGFAFFED